MKIVIVGGGTAGWITAAMVLKYRTDVDVTVIESSKIPIIGAGEGSADSFRWFINQDWPNDMVNEVDFLKKTKATLKLAINLKNWKGDGSYMYSPLYTTPSNRAPIDKVFYASIYKYGKSDMGSINSWILEDNIASIESIKSKIRTTDIIIKIDTAKSPSDSSDFSLLENFNQKLLEIKE